MQQEVIEFLASGRAWDGEMSVRRVDTHAATVFLVGDRAWKLKHAVRLPYLDFSTSERRRAALERELELNRRTAPELYLAVKPIVRGPDGWLRIDGPGEPVDWILEMRRFPDGALLSEIADDAALPQHLLVELADRVAAFLSAAVARPSTDGFSRLSQVIEDNFVAAAGCKTVLDAGRLENLKRQHRWLLGRHADLLTRRGREGRIRRGHGDLHLGNIALVGSRLTLFDCLEFDEELATTDTLYELAFLLMDLWRRDLRREANIVCNRYLDLIPADETGISLLPLLMSVRALVRAHVEAAASAQNGAHVRAADDARDCLRLAERLLDPARPMLVAIGGLSGTGKSTIARHLAGSLGRPPGARILRSDVLRKRLVGLPPESDLPEASYTETSSEAVYAELQRTAEQVLAAGHSVVADAVFARANERHAIETVAARQGAEFGAIWLEVPLAVRLSRIGTRGRDASDASAAVARAQESYDIGALGEWRTVSAGGEVAEAVGAVRAALPACFRA